MVYKTVTERAAKLAADAAKRIAAKKKAGTYVKPKKTTLAEDSARDQFLVAQGKLKEAKKYGFTKANSREKLEKKVKSSRENLKKVLKEEGSKLDTKDFFNKGGAVNSKKSCGLAVRGHGKVIK